MAADKPPQMVNMRRTGMIGGGMDYPGGLCISLTKAELDKLDLADDAKVGDILHLHALARVISVSSSDHETLGEDGRIELALTDMSVENEDDENEEVDAGTKRRRKLYG